MNELLENAKRSMGALRLELPEEIWRAHEEAILPLFAAERERNGAIEALDRETSALHHEVADVRMALESRDQDMADLRNRIIEFAKRVTDEEREVSRFRNALWQIAYNVPEHEGETDSSYEEWARKFARETLDDIAF